MLLHRSPLFQIYFGDSSDNLFSSYYKQLANEPSLISHPPFNAMAEIMQLQMAIFLNQTHSTNGLVVSGHNAGIFRSFASEGDYLLTDLSQVGIGIMTADCLPIIFFDAVHNAAGIVHAGWKGSVNNIATKALAHMQEIYGTNIDQVQVFFGPSAKPCCYEVGADFAQHINNKKHAEQTLSIHDEKLFFDLPRLNTLQLIEMGVPKTAIRLTYNICTMCHAQFQSHRRDGAQAGRQMTVISLN